MSARTEPPPVLEPTGPPPGSRWAVSTIFFVGRRLVAQVMARPYYNEGPGHTEHVVTSVVHASYRPLVAASVQAGGSYQIIRLTPDAASAEPAHTELANGMATLEVWERIAGR